MLTPLHWCYNMSGVKLTPEHGMTFKKLGPLACVKLFFVFLMGNVISI